MKPIALGLVAFLAAPLAFGQWYASNAVGFVGEAIDSAARADFEYVLQVERTDSGESRLLYKGDDVVRQTDVMRTGSGSTETVYRDGTIDSRRETDANGLVRVEEIFAVGLLDEVRRYEYVDGAVAVRRVWDADETLVSTDRYAYWGDGSLRSIRREEPSERITDYKYRDGRLAEEWVSEPTRVERFQLDNAGRLIARWLWVEGELDQQEARSYWGDDAEAELRSVTILAAARDTASSRLQTTSRTYDQAGRLQEEVISDGDVVVSRRTLQYRDERLMGEVEVSGDGERTWEYVYDGDGLASTTYREDGVIVTVTRYAPPESDVDRIEVIHKDGVPALRVYYRDARRVAEEVLRNGEVIRRREFAPTGDAGS